jgi:serine/threonine protein phosphatase PrpC
VRLLFAESRTGRFYDNNFDRYIADVNIPLLAVVDSEFNDGFAGDTLVSALLEARPALSNARTSDDAQRLLVGALRRTHAALFAKGHKGGAAVTVVTCVADILVGAHVGDCRLYVREPHGWVRKTHDHTLREQTREAGLPLPDAEERRRYSGIITRTIGLTQDVVVDTVEFRDADRRQTVTECFSRRP